jgi:hypothetical protein
MGFFLYLFLFLIISVVARIYYLFFRKKPHHNKNNKNKEGFESLTNCLSLGYPDDFCKRAPLEACISNCPLGNFKKKVFKVFE